MNGRLHAQAGVAEFKHSTVALAFHSSLRLHAQAGVAELKRSLSLTKTGGINRSPRASRRGRIEAVPPCRCTASFDPSPRASRRGRIEASSEIHTHGVHANRLHAQAGVAELKRRPVSEDDRHTYVVSTRKQAWPN